MAQSVPADARRYFRSSVVGVMQKASWARWTGIITAGFAVVSNLSWAQVQPQQGLIGAFLAVLVVYGLAVYAKE